MSDRKVSIAYVMTICVFIAQILDVFFIHADKKIFADNILARIIGIVFAIIAAKMVHFNLKKHCFKTYGFLFEILYGIGFAVIPIAICYLFEIVYFRIRNYGDVTVSFSVPNSTAFLGLNLQLTPILIYVITLLLGALFKEMFFRGYLITQLMDKYGMKKANIIQSILYASLSLPNIFYTLISGNFKGLGIPLTIYLVVAYPLNNFLCGIKWGYFYRVNGTIWMSLADHLANNFLLTCLYISPDRLPEKWFVLEVFAVQIMSCLMFIPFYTYRDNTNTMVAEEIKVSMEVLKPEKVDFASAENEDDVIPLSEIKRKIAGSTGKKEEKPKHLPKATKLEITEKPNAETKKQPEKIQTEEKTDDISKLVNNYFNKEFDKHTFSK